MERSEEAAKAPAWNDPVADRLWRAAWWCWFVPLTIGLALFVSWCAWPRDILVGLSFINAASGTILLVTGWGCLGLFRARVRDNPMDGAPRRRVWSRLLLLVSNLFVGVGLLYLGTWVDSRAEVTVINESGRTVPRVTVENQEGRSIAEFRDVPAGGTGSAGFFAKRFRHHDASYLFFFRVSCKDGMGQQHVLEGTDTVGDRPRFIVRITESGPLEWEVHRAPR